VGKLLEIENEGSICKHLVDAGLIHSLEGEEMFNYRSSFKLVEASVNLTQQGRKQPQLVVQKIF